MEPVMEFVEKEELIFHVEDQLHLLAIRKLLRLDSNKIPAKETKEVLCSMDFFTHPFSPVL
jgi:hypothetical protein